MQQLAQAAQTAHDAGEGFAFRREGDVKAGLQAAARQVRAVYSAPYLAHVTMEPMNCTVQVREGAATVWAPTQVPGAAREAAARVLGLPDEAVALCQQVLHIPTCGPLHSLNVSHALAIGLYAAASSSPQELIER